MIARAAPAKPSAAAGPRPFASAMADRVATRYAPLSPLSPYDRLTA